MLNYTIKAGMRDNYLVLYYYCC